MVIMGIDHNTVETGIVVGRFCVDEYAFEEIDIYFNEAPIKLSRKLDLQERLNAFSNFLQDNLSLVIDEFHPEVIVRERHDPYGTSSNQMFMFSGVLDAFMFSKGYSFKTGNYKQITPIEWKMITLLSPYHEVKKNTKKEKEKYCSLFKSMFDIPEILEETNTDVMDAFGLFYSFGVRYWGEKNEEFFLALNEEQQRNIKKDGVFKTWGI